MHNGPVLEMSVVEMVFLCSMLEGDSLLGVDDPFDGWLAHQVEEEWMKVLPLLERRGMISRSKEGLLSIDQEVAELLETCCKPRAALVLTRWNSDGVKQVWACYASAGMTVTNEAGSAPQERRLSSIAESGELKARLETLLPVIEVTALAEEDRGGGKVPAAVVGPLMEARKDGRQVLVEYLHSKAPGFTKQDLFAGAVAEPVSYSMLVLVNRFKEDSTAAGFSLLEGRNGLWLLRPFEHRGEEWFEIALCDSVEFDRALGKLADNFKLAAAR